MELTGSQIVIECLKEQGVDDRVRLSGGNDFEYLSMSFTVIRKSTTS